MPIDPRISLGVQQLQLNDPLTQYGQVQNILAAQAQQRSAGTQNELAQTQLGQARITVQQAQQAQDTIAQIMKSAEENNAPTKDPMDAAMQMARHPLSQVNEVGKRMLENIKLIQEYEAQARYLKDQGGIAPVGPSAAVAPQFAESPAFGAQGRAAAAEPAAAISTPGAAAFNQQNKLAPAAAAPPVNAMAAPQAATAESILAKIKQGNILYRGSPGWLDERKLLEEQYKQLLKPEVMHVVDGNLVSPSGKVMFQGAGKLERMEVPQADGTIKYYTFDPRTGKTSEVNAPGVATGMSSPNIRAQELKLQQDKFVYEKANPGSTVHTVVADDGTTSLLAVGKDGKATKVTLGGIEVKGVDTSAKRLAYEQANPGKEIREVTNENGTVSVFAIDKITGVATPITMGGADLSGVNTTAQRLKFDKDKLAYEQANPDKEIKEVNNEDGTTSYFGIDKRTGVATPITMGANAQAIPATGAGQLLVGVKLNAPPSMVAEYTFAKTADGGNFKGSYQDFVTARAKAGRAPAQPVQPSAPVAVVGDDGKIRYVSREEAISKNMTPAAALEGLSPKEIQKREASYPQATTSVKAIEKNTDNLIKDLKTLRDHPGLNSITGIAAGRLPGLTSDGRAAQALYDKIIAKGGFQVLQDMREASKTGGALGNVSDKEGAQLKSAFEAIDRKQDAADVRKALDAAISTAEGSKVRVRESYDMTYDYKNQGKAPTGAVDANNPLLKGK